MRSMYTVVWHDGESVGGILNMSAVEGLAQRRSVGSRIADIPHERGIFKIYDITDNNGDLIGVCVRANWGK